MGTFRAIRFCILSHVLRDRTSRFFPPPWYQSENLQSDSGTYKVHTPFCGNSLGTIPFKLKVRTQPQTLFTECSFLITVSTHLGVENPKQALEISAKDIARERNAVKSITRGVIAEKRTPVLLSAPQLTSQFGSPRHFVPPQRERRKGCENSDLLGG